MKERAHNIRHLTFSKVPTMHALVRNAALGEAARNSKLSKRKWKSRARWLSSNLNLYHFRPGIKFTIQRALRKTHLSLNRKTPRWNHIKGYRSLRIATANVSGFCNEYSLSQLACIASRHKVDFLAIQETHSVKDDDAFIREYKYLSSESAKTTKGPRKGGVGLLIHSRFADLVERVHRISHRLMRVKMQKPGNCYAAIDITVAYAPHMGYDEPYRDTFWTKLHWVEGQKN